MEDYFEMRERCAEDMYFDMLQPNGKLKCSCGDEFEEGDGGTTSPDPYAMPVCPKCLEGWMGEMQKINDRKEKDE